MDRKAKTQSEQKTANTRQATFAKPTIEENYEQNTTTTTETSKEQKTNMNSYPNATIYKHVVLIETLMTEFKTKGYVCHSVNHTPRNGHLTH